MGYVKNFGIWYVLLGNFIVVVGNIDFLFVFVSLVVVVEGIVEDIGIVCCMEVVGCGNRGIIVEVWCFVYLMLFCIVVLVVMWVDNLV